MLAQLRMRFKACGLELHPLKTRIVYCRDGLRTESELKELAKSINPTLRGWINYYGKFYSSALRAIARYLNEDLSRWLIRKYQKPRL
jgi:hypothetical protein